MPSCGAYTYMEEADSLAQQQVHSPPFYFMRWPGQQLLRQQQHLPVIFLSIFSEAAAKYSSRQLIVWSQDPKCPHCAAAVWLPFCPFTGIPSSHRINQISSLSCSFFSAHDYDDACACLYSLSHPPLIVRLWWHARIISAPWKKAR